MRGHGAVEVGGGCARRVVQRVGQVDREVRDEGPRVLALARRRAQPELATPQGAQVHREPAVHVHEERAPALLLQDGERVRARQGEVALLRGEVGRVRPRAPQRPAPEAPEREHGEEAVEVLEQGAHAARRLRDELLDQAQPPVEEFRVGQAPRRRRARRDRQRDHRAARLRGERKGAAQEPGDRLLAGLAGHGGRLADEVRDGLGAAPQGVERACPPQVVLEPARREGARGLLPGGAQHLGGVRAQVVEQFAVVVEVRAHGGPSRAGSEIGGDRGVERVAHVGVVGDGPHQRDAAGGHRPRRRAP